MTKTVFITARFRSGSSLLWRIFEQMPGTCAYYEPLHELLLTHIANKVPPDPSHRGITSYWEAFARVQDELPRHYRNEFATTKLLLEESDEYPELANYLKFLANGAGKGNIAILQCNRIDFRLPWLRRHFPDAVIIHLFRNPRNQWLSATKGLSSAEREAPLINAFDNLTVSCALAEHFPFLFSKALTTSYHRHYLLWKLSGIMGRRLANRNISYDDDLLRQPEKTMQTVISDLWADGDHVNIHDCCAMIRGNDEESWLRYKSEGWFLAIEKECETILDDLGLLDFFGMRPLSDIKRQYRHSWNRYPAQEHLGRAIRKALLLYVRASNANNDNYWYAHRMEKKMPRYYLARLKKFFRV